MKRVVLKLLLLLFCTNFSFSQSIKHIDGTKVNQDTLTAHIKQLMAKANICGLAICVYNKNVPVYTQTFGLSNVQAKIPFSSSQVMYAASFSKTVFAYIVMQLVQEKVIDLDKPLISYLSKPLPDYKISGWKRGYQDIKNDKRCEKITARMCLDHSTGLPNYS